MKKDLAFLRRGLATIVLLLFFFVMLTSAHPLGNFTINHFARIEPGTDQVNLRYVIDMAEIPTFQERTKIDLNGDDTLSQNELDAYAAQAARQYADGLLFTIDGAPIALSATSQQISLLPGAGGLFTLRLEINFIGQMPAINISAINKIHFEDKNHIERIGWHEIVVKPANGISVFNSNAYGNAITDELKAYPADMLTAPLNERSANFSLTRGAAPAKSTPLLTRDGRPMAQSRDRLAELIAVPQLTLPIALLGLLLAFLLGGLHALSPGHGKTIVGAYLVGSRGTARHAAFLGLTVTITHTAGVFALGLITLFASQYIVPERLFPLLSLISGMIVVGIGLSLFIRRLLGALGYSIGEQAHTHAAGEDLTAPHSHGGKVHSHLPPTNNGAGITWRSLLALGISGGLLPCPSALVVLLSAISLHRVGYGLLMVVTFSMGLAGILTGIGLLFVYARRFIDRPFSTGRITQILPVCSAVVITLAGVAICYEAVAQTGLTLSGLINFIFHSA